MLNFYFEGCKSKFCIIMICSNMDSSYCLEYPLGESFDFPMRKNLKKFLTLKPSSGSSGMNTKFGSSILNCMAVKDWQTSPLQLLI